MSDDFKVSFNMISMARLGVIEVIEKKYIKEAPKPTYTKIGSLDNMLSLMGIIYVDAGDDYIFPFKFEVELLFEFNDLDIRSTDKLYELYKGSPEEWVFNILRADGGIIVNNTMASVSEGISNGR